MHRLWQRIYDYWDYIYFPGLRRRIAGVAALVVAAIVAAVCLYRPPLPDEVEQAEPLIATHPDSAYALLTRVEQRVQDCSESNRMRFYLLLADAANKAFGQLPSDSLMRCVADHYDRHGTSNEQMLAHYLLGCTYRDLNNRSKAQEEYFHAVESADTTSTECNYPLLARVYGQLASIYELQTSHQLALDMYERTAQYALRGRDSLLWVDAYRQRIVPYTDLGMWDSVELVCRRSSELYKAHGDSTNVIANYQIMAMACLKLGRIPEAGRYISLFEAKSGLVSKEHFIAPGFRNASYYTIKGLYYLETSKLDSAILFFRRGMSVGEDTYVRGAYKNLSKAYKKIGLKDSVLKYQDLYAQALIEKYDKQVGENLQELQINFDLERERINTRKKELEAQRLSICIYWIIGLALLSTSLVYSLYIIRRKKYRITIAQLKRSKYNLERLERETAERVSILESSETERQTKISELQEQLLKYKTYLQNIQDFGSKLVPWDLKSNDALANSRTLSVVDKLRFYAKGKESLYSSHPLWEELYDYVEIHNPQLILFLATKERKLNEREQRVCYLIWVGFTPTEMSILLASSKQNISSIRSRLLWKLFQEEGKPEDFDRKILKISPVFH